VSIKRCPADKAFSDAVRANRYHVCEHCKKADGRMECAHIFGRRHKSVRWDTLNALCLCHTCHRHFTENPVDFTRWLEGYVGAGYLDILREKSQRICKTTKAMRSEIANHYRQELKHLEAGPHDLVSYQ
jgi:hypothetical protein